MKLTATLIAIIGVALLAGKFLLGRSGSTHKTAISAEEAHSLIASGTTVLVLDVRTPEEYIGELGHIQNSVLIPVQELESRIAELERFKDKTILAVCRSGRRSGKATEILLRNGYKGANVEGGMLAWNGKKLPVSH